MSARLFPVPPESPLTKEQAARYLQCSLRSLDRHIKDRGLPACRRGGCVRLYKQEIDEWLREGRKGRVA